jgi:glycosyltransferase involved in cell wall biosynthesis
VNAPPRPPATVGCDDLVTVYMPTKNRQALLVRAIESVLNQDHAALELIVVDDASDDGTPDCLRELAACDPRLRTIRHERSRGASAARNTAIRAARGRFVTGLDDDDRFLPARLSTLVAYWRLLQLAGETPAFLYTPCVTVGPEGTGVWLRPGRTSYADMFDGNWVGNQVFAPREHFVDAGLFDEDLPAWQDLELFMRMLQKYGPARLLDLATYEFEVGSRDGRISTAGAHQIRAAYRHVAHKHAPRGGRDAQRLLLQVFARYYRIRPRPRDWVEFGRHGWWFRGFRQLLAAYLRR